MIQIISKYKLLLDTTNYESSKKQLKKLVTAYENVLIQAVKKEKTE